MLQKSEVKISLPKYANDEITPAPAAKNPLNKSIFRRSCRRRVSFPIRAKMTPFKCAGGSTALTLFILFLKSFSMLLLRSRIGFGCFGRKLVAKREDCTAVFAFHRVWRVSHNFSYFGKGKALLVMQKQNCLVLR